MKREKVFKYVISKDGHYLGMKDEYTYPKLKKNLYILVITSICILLGYLVGKY